MFRILAECSKVEVDDALSLAIEKVKEMQNSGQLSGIAGSIKIPDFINGGMLKMLPKDKKMELMEQSMHQEKSRIMAMLQPAISRVIGPVQILDFQMKAMPAAGLDATMRVDVEIQDADRVIDLITEKLIEECDLPEILGEHFEPSINMENIAFYMKGQPADTKEYLIVKSLSVKKAFLSRKMESIAADKQLGLSIAALRFMMKDK